MIIYGTKHTTKTLQQGEFYCPHCTTRRAYVMARRKRWFHIYWIPLAPMEELPPYVECQVCKNAWQPKILEFDPEADRKEANRQIRRGIAYMLAKVASAAHLSPSRTEAEIASTLTELTGEASNAEEANRLMAEAATEGKDAEVYAKDLANLLSDRGRELVLRAAVSLAKLDGAAAPAELTPIGLGLGMSSAHVSGVIAEMLGATPGH